MALNYPPEASGTPDEVERETGSADASTLPSLGVLVLVLLILLAIVTIIVLAWLGPVAGSDWATVTSAAWLDPHTVATPARPNLHMAMLGAKSSVHQFSIWRQ